MFWLYIVQRLSHIPYIALWTKIDQQSGPPQWLFEYTYLTGENWKKKGLFWNQFLFTMDLSHVTLLLIKYTKNNLKILSTFTFSFPVLQLSNVNSALNMGKKEQYIFLVIKIIIVSNPSRLYILKVLLDDLIL